MSTAATIIDRALRLLGQIPGGSTGTTDEYTDGLIALNALLDSWRNDELLCYATQEEILSLVNATSSYTIGPAGSLNTTRPVEIEDAWVVDNNVSYHVSVVTNAEYDAIPAKTTSSNWPDRLTYAPTMPTGTIYVYPVPNAARSLHLRTRIPLTSFAATTDSISLPPGWERAMAFNLAVDWAPEFEIEPSPTVIQMAKASKSALKSTNSPLYAYTSELVGMNRPGFNIQTGQ